MLTFARLNPDANRVDPDIQKLTDRIYEREFVPTFWFK